MVCNKWINKTIIIVLVLMLVISYSQVNIIGITHQQNNITNYKEIIDEQVDKINNEISLKDDKNIDSVSVESNMTWSIVDGTLYINGSGAMESYNSWNTPWYDQKENIRNLIISDDITTITASAFYGCTNLVSVTLPKKLRIIESSAFRESGLTSLKLPDTIEELGYDVFRNCSGLKEVIIPKSLKKANSSFSNSGIEKAVIEEGASEVVGGLFQSANKLKEVIIPESVTTIGNSSFYECSNLVSVTLPKKLRIIESSAFRQSGLTSLKLPDTIEELGYDVFRNCSGLKEVIIPKSLKKANSPFFNSGIEKAVIEEGASEVVGGLFQSANKLKEVIIPESVTTIGNSSFYGCSNLVSVTLPSKLRTIESYSFMKCPQLNKVYIPETVVSFKNNVFKDSSLLTIYCQYDSHATLYAIDNNIPFIASKTERIDSDLTALNYEKTYYQADVSNVSINGFVSMDLEYAIKEAKKKEISNLSIQIRIPDNTVLKEETIKLNGKLCQNFIYENNILTIPITESNGQLNFYVQPSDSLYLMSYAKLIYTKDSKKTEEIIGIINESINDLSISTNQVTSKDEIIITGIAPKSADIEIFVDEKLIKTVTSSKAGKYSTSIKLENLSNNKSYQIQAKCTVQKTDYSAQTNVTYKDNVPELKNLKLYYNGHSDKAVDLTDPANIPYISFAPSIPFTFTADFSNKEKIENVYIVSTRNNEKRFLEATYDEKSDLYIASGYFDESNHYYVPGSISVDINCKQETIKVSDQLDFDKSKIPDNFKNCKVEKIETGSNKEEKYRFDIINLLPEALNDLEHLFVDTTISIYDEKFDSSLGDSLGPVISAGKLLGYVIPGSDRHNYFVSSEYSEYGGFTLIAKDLSETVDNVVKLAVKFDDSKVYNIFNQKFDISELSDALGYAATFYDVMNEIYEFSKDNEQLKNDIMASTTIKDKSIALKQAETLLENQKNYAIMAALLPLLVTSIGITGPVAIAFTSLIGIIGASSQFFWSARVAQIKGEKRSMRFIIDPSGYVYEGVESNRLQDVKVTAYYKEKLEDKESVLWDASEYNQVNPLFTNNEGRYAWDVPEGYWQVKYEKDGYETTYSDWLEVPPPQTEVNIAMVSYQKPVVDYIEVNPDSIHLVFDKYMIPESIANIVLKDKNSKSIDFELVYDKDKLDTNGNVLAKSYTLKLKDYNFKIDENCSIEFSDSIKSYANVGVEKQVKTLKCKEPVNISVPNSISLQYGNEYIIPVTINSNDENISIGAVSKFEELVKIVSINKVSSKKWNVVVKGILPGMSNVKIFVNDSSINKNVEVNTLLNLETTEQLLGDINGDNEINYGDAVLVLQNDSGAITLTENQLKVADVNKNGVVDYNDAVLILKYDAGNISGF